MLFAYLHRPALNNTQTKTGFEFSQIFSACKDISLEEQK